MKAYRVSIFLAENQWGNEVMEREAVAYATSLFKISHAFDNPQCPLIADVIEHAGWALSFYISPKNPIRHIIVGTANDAAVFSAEQKTIREEIARAEVTQLPECRNKGVDNDD